MSESSSPSEEPPRYLRVVNVDPSEESDTPAQALQDASRGISTWLDHSSSDGTNWTELRELRRQSDLYDARVPLPGHPKVDQPLLGQPYLQDKNAVFLAYPWTKFLHWVRSKGFHGWRLGVLIGCSTAVFVCCVNITILVLGAAVPGGYQHGVANLVQGSAQRVTTWSIVFHVLINALSTLLLSASNYTMQVLNAPTREDVDVAHARGLYLDIGILSTRNLRHISKKRRLLWWTLAISSAPLHIFYNSSVFDVILGNEFAVQTLEYSSPEYRSFNTTPYQNFTNQQWQSLYSGHYISGVGDLYLIADGISVTVPAYRSLLGQNSLSTIATNALNLTFVRSSKLASSVIPSMTHDGWMDASAFASTNGNPIRIRHAYARTIETGNSKLQLSLFFLLIVVFCNIAKAAVMLLALLDSQHTPLVTIGDALASYLERPDPVTAGLCTLSKEDMLIHFKIEKPSLRITGSEQKAARLKERLDGRWKARKRQYGTGISDGRQVFGMIIISLMFLAALTLVLTSSPESGLSSWGTSSMSTLGAGSGRFDAIGSLTNAALANLPQIFFSIGYLTFNGFFTCLAAVFEWDNMAIGRKSLRVTEPKGEQRSTYFLQLPLKFAVPLTVTSGIVHWLMSQSIFLVRIDIQDRNGQLTQESRSACGFSWLSFLVLCTVFTVLLCLVVIICVWRWRTNLPLAASCSLVISAACHPPLDEIDPHLKPLQWGVTHEGTEDSVGHCSLSTKEVTRPKYGHRYA